MTYQDQRTDAELATVQAERWEPVREVEVLP